MNKVRNGMQNAMIFDIQHGSLVDGPGWRTTVFFKGCGLRCLWCHNPEGISPEPQLLFYRERCAKCGLCREVCPRESTDEPCRLCGACAYYCPKEARKLCGKQYTVEEVLSEILADRAFYENAGGGATFSGGECMLQIDFLAEVLRRCRENGIHTAVDTAGAVPWEHFARVLPCTDLFLYDMKCFAEEKHIAGTGRSNRGILDNLARLAKVCADRILVRVPIVPGFNTDEAKLRAMAEFLRAHGLAKVELLPYHGMGKAKAEALGVPFTPFEAPTKEDMARYRSIFGQ